MRCVWSGLMLFCLRQNCYILNNVYADMYRIDASFICWRSLFSSVSYKTCLNVDLCLFKPLFNPRTLASRFCSAADFDLCNSILQSSLPTPFASESSFSNPRVFIINSALCLADRCDLCNAWSKQTLCSDRRKSFPGKFLVFLAFVVVLLLCD